MCSVDNICRRYQVPQADPVTYLSDVCCTSMCMYCSSKKHKHAYQFCLQASGSAASSKAKPEPAAKSDSGTHTINLQETFYARPQDIYECFTQAGKIQAFTQSPAQAQPDVGGSFSMFGGSVQGTYKELVPFSRLRLDWRFANWPDDATSKVRGQGFCLDCCSVALAFSLGA